MANALPNKDELRCVVQRRLRDHVSDLDEHSRRIWRRLLGIDGFSEAKQNGRLMAYLDFGEEVRIAEHLLPDLSAGRIPSLIVPRCEGNEIVPVRIFSPDDLESGVFGIREPKKELPNRPGRFVDPAEIDFVIVPGLAFDRYGNRLGRGRGYYDRFLATLSPNAITASPAFECQLFEHVPTDPQDRRVGLIVTERQVVAAEPFERRCLNRRSTG